MDIEKSPDKRLDGKNVLLIDDVSTTGKELWHAAMDIRKAGGNVHEIILYYSRLPEKSIEKFLENGISIYPLLRPSDARYLLSNLSSEFPDLDVNKIKKVFMDMNENIEYEGTLENAT
jgi:orotate phosphoribosyltransferase